MADWTLSTATCFRPRYTRGGYTRIQSWQTSTCASTATISAGHVVTADTVVSTAGIRLVRAPSTSSNSAMVVGAGINVIGIAAEGCTGDGSTLNMGNKDMNRIQVYVAGPNVEFIGWLKGALPVSSSLVLTQKLIAWDSTLKTYFIDSSNSTVALAAVTITGFPREAEGDTNGPVFFKFLSSLMCPVL
jgi:hypothetical protein